MATYTGSRICRLNDMARRMGIDILLVSSPASVLYYTGYFFYFEHGPSPFHLLPAMLVTAGAQPPELLLADNELQQAAHIDPAIHITPYISYTFEEALPFDSDLTRHLLRALSGRLKGNSRVGIEKNFLPLAIAEALASAFPEAIWVDIAPLVERQRIIKDADEVDNIRRAAALADAGQAVVLEYAREGQSELELFSLVRRQLDSLTGTRVPLMADLVSGERTASGGGIPSGKKISKGDLVISDLTPCLNGYWGDSCNTVVIGGATSDQQKIFSDVKKALEAAISIIRPGIRASEIDTMLRKRLGSYGHHSGHGVGVMSHEEPRIVPYNHTELQSGMVIALEPAVYTPKFGIRLEHLILVTDNGCELLTRFDHQLQRI